MGRKEALDGDKRLAGLEEVDSLLLASCSGTLRSFGSRTWASDACWQLVCWIYVFILLWILCCENWLAH